MIPEYPEKKIPLFRCSAIYDPEGHSRIRVYNDLGVRVKLFYCFDIFVAKAAKIGQVVFGDTKAQCPGMLRNIAQQFQGG